MNYKSVPGSSEEPASVSSDGGSLLLLQCPKVSATAGKYDQKYSVDLNHT